MTVPPHHPSRGRCISHYVMATSCKFNYGSHFGPPTFLRVSMHLPIVPHRAASWLQCEMILNPSS